MKQRRICKRCHRLRVVNDVSYCAYCNDELRKMEQRRAVDGVSVVSDALATALEEEHALAQASTEPPPPEGGA